MNQPLVDLVQVKDVLARQHSHAVALRKVSKTDGALRLLVEPGRIDRLSIDRLAAHVRG